MPTIQDIFRDHQDFIQQEVVRLSGEERPDLIKRIRRRLINDNESILVIFEKGEAEFGSFLQEVVLEAWLRDIQIRKILQDAHGLISQEIARLSGTERPDLVERTRQHLLRLSDDAIRAYGNGKFQQYLQRIALDVWLGDRLMNFYGCLPPQRSCALCDMWFREIKDAYEPTLLRQLKSKLNETYLAGSGREADAVQRIWLHVIRTKTGKPKPYDPERGLLMTWLKLAAKREYFNLTRGRDQADRRSGAPENDEGSHYEDGLVEKRESHELRADREAPIRQIVVQEMAKFIKNLGNPCQFVVRARLEELLTFGDIMGLTGLELEVIRERLRSRRRGAPLELDTDDELIKTAELIASEHNRPVEEVLAELKSPGVLKNGEIAAILAIRDDQATLTFQHCCQLIVAGLQ